MHVSSYHPGYHTSGEWSYCNFPFIRTPKSAAHIDISTGKFAPRYVTANSWWITSVFWGGKSGVMKGAMEVMAGWIEADEAAGERGRRIISQHDMI